MTARLRAMNTAWVVEGDVPGPDVDEFADAASITRGLANAETDSLLAVQHPHRTPEAIARGLSLADALPHARTLLAGLQRKAYREVHDVVAPYSIEGPDGHAMGLLCLADPSALTEDGASWVRRSEEVYRSVVDERAAVLTALRCATSAALLVPLKGGPDLTSAVAAVCPAEPAVSTEDSAGRVHRLWLLGAGPERDRLLQVAGRHPLLVADGNHRVAAATVAGVRGMLAIVTAGPRLMIGAINRVLIRTGLTLRDLGKSWREAGLEVREAEPSTEPEPGIVIAQAGSQALAVRLPDPAADEPLPRIDHGVVERVLVAQALGIDPDGPHLRALPAARQPAEDVDVVLRLAPVPWADIVTVHEQRRRMPRKATFFTPKPRSGLLLAEL